MLTGQRKQNCLRSLHSMHTSFSEIKQPYQDRCLYLVQSSISLLYSYAFSRLNISSYHVPRSTRWKKLHKAESGPVGMLILVV